MERDMLKRYRQVAFETRERRPGYTVTIVPVTIGDLGDRSVTETLFSLGSLCKIFVKPLLMIFASVYTLKY